MNKMKSSFNWGKFSRAFLISVLTSEQTIKKYRLTEENASDIKICAYMERLCPYPGEWFIRNYRREIEDFFLSGSTELVTICRKLQNMNYRGVSVSTPDEMLAKIKSLNMTSTLIEMYSAALRQHGRDINISDNVSFFSAPKEIDLTNSISGDINLADYQQEAVGKMSDFFITENNSAGILVLPTGSGKTRTAVYFLLRNMISRGYQVIWLAHRSMLLEQTADAFYKYSYLIKNDTPQKERLSMICISGEHCTIKAASKDNDIVIGSVQSLVRNTDYLPAIINDKTIIVVDEAHHTVAPSYRKIIEKIHSFCPSALLLGLTATPVRMSEEATYQLMKLYNDKIIYSISMGELIAKGVLSRPSFEIVNTNFDIEAHIDIDEKKYIEKWGELSPELVDYLASVCERNEIIVKKYLRNKFRYGKTLIFAMNAHHCISLCELLKEHDVKCDYIYSYERNNEEKIQRFRNGELEVLVNINILTEGSDIADIETVFLTRPTQSDVLLMQMIGRGMRGKNYGGTETVNIVDFCDKWDNFTQWLNPRFVFGDNTPYTEITYSSKKTELFPWKMFKDIIDGITYTYSKSPEFICSLPVGWYKACGTSVIVFENQLTGYEMMMSEWKKVICGTAANAIKKYFRMFGPMPSRNDLELVIKQMIADNAPLKLYKFSSRSRIDPSEIVNNLKKCNASVGIAEKKINDIYETHKEFIDEIYNNKESYRQTIYNHMIYNCDKPVYGGKVSEFTSVLKEYDTTPCYDINILKCEVVKEMFAGEFDNLPEIEWTAFPQESYFGQYDKNNNFILINSILNSASVPRETVKYVIYHELLHTITMYHSPRFRELEHKYPEYTEHERFLDVTFKQFDLSDAM